MKRLTKAILIVLLIFLGFELVAQTLGSVGASYLYASLYFGKYTTYLMAELTVLILCLILLIILKRWKIFKEHKVSFKDSLKLGLPILVISLVYFILNGITLLTEEINIYSLISLIIYVVLVGLYEEVFFRGIIQNELIDRYGEGKREIYTSIVISSLIFGCMHFTNLLAGQDILTTLMQVIQTSAVGFLFGSMYYKSRNIWGNIFLHSFYDLAILLSEVNLIKDCSYVGTVPLSVTINSLLVSLILSLIYILYGIKVLKEDERKNKLFNSIIGILVILFFIVVIIFSICFDEDGDYYVCYSYDEVTFERIETHYYSYDDYTIYVGDSQMYIYLDKSRAILKDNTTLEEIDLGIDNVTGIVVVDNKIMIITYYLGEYVLYYSDYLTGDIVDLEQMSDTFITLAVPDIDALGYLMDADTNTKYLMVRSSTYDKFIIMDNELYLVK